MAGLGKIVAKKLYDEVIYKLGSNINRKSVNKFEIEAPFASFLKNT